MAVEHSKSYKQWAEVVDLGVPYSADGLGVLQTSPLPMCQGQSPDRGQGGEFYLL